MNYHNENDKHAAQWLRNLIAKGLIPDGHVDERSIVDVSGSDLAGFEQCHFFAGIGGWPLALQLAGWEGPVWTGSCPCQPFSAAGKRKGTEDARHLWPELRRLIAECRPVTVFGEQVESKDGRQWLAGVRSDVEATDLCAPSVKAPHRRQRLYWVAESGQEFCKPWSKRRSHEQGATERSIQAIHAERCGSLSRLVQPIEPGLEGFAGYGDRGDEPGRIASITDGSTAEAGSTGGLVQSDSTRRFTRITSTETARHGGSTEPASGAIGGMELPTLDRREQRRTESIERSIELRCGARDPWSDFDIVHCKDGKARRIEAGTFPLANGVSGRVGKLRAYGNAIVPPLAAEFIKAYMNIQGTFTPGASVRFGVSVQGESK